MTPMKAGKVIEEILWLGRTLLKIESTYPVFSLSKILGK